MHPDYLKIFDIFFPTFQHVHCACKCLYMNKQNLVLVTVCLSTHHKRGRHTAPTACRSAGPHSTRVPPPPTLGCGRSSPPPPAPGTHRACACVSGACPTPSAGTGCLSESRSPSHCTIGHGQHSTGLQKTDGKIVL